MSISAEERSRPASSALPELRQELRLVGRSSDLEGEQQWMVYDPVQHRFIGLDRKSFAMMEAWAHAKTPDDIVASAWSRRAEIVTHDDVASVAQVLLQSGLAIPHDEGERLRMLQSSAGRKQNLGSALLHGYLFFRVPLANPEPFVRAILPLVTPLAARRTAWVIASIGLLGLLLVSKEWDGFVAAVGGLASVDGVIWLGIALATAKLAHEFAHAAVAMHYGCRVPVLGVAFVLGAPLLYVDVTDAWKLKSIRARTAINAAGIAADLVIATCALLLWGLLPPGLARDIALAFATTGWILSLTINLNPFMKFDGYHVVADLVGTANLQARSIAMAQWALREALFAFKAEPPEPCAARARAFLVAFGAAVWIYRVLLFTGIAVAVYHYFFKLLGLLLFAVEIAYFVAIPVLREMVAWWGLRKSAVRTGRWRITAMLSVLLVLVLAMPWSSAVYIPAVLEPASLSRIHVPRAARLVDASISSGDPVEVGSPLAHFISPELQHERDIVALKTAVVELRLSRIAGDATDREAANVLDREWTALREEASGLARNAELLKVASPVAGRLATVAEYLLPGRWITRDEPLTIVHGSGSWQIRGLVDGANLTRIRTGDSAMFVPDDYVVPSVRASVGEVSRANAPVVEQVELARVHGGRIQTRPGERNSLVPVEPQYAVRAIPVDLGFLTEKYGTAPRVGLLVVTGEARSIASRFWKRLAQVMIRESGF